MSSFSRTHPARARRAIDRFFRASGKLLTLGPSGWFLLVRAQLAVLGADRIVSRTPQGELFRRLSAPVEADNTHTVQDAPSPDPKVRARIDEVGLAIDRVARAGCGRPLCLVRSIAYRRMLERDGIRGAHIRIGVRKARRGFEAHAWIEWRGAVVGEDPDYVAEFLPLPDLPRDVSEEPLRWASPDGRSPS